jgi:hypothetical protein
MRVTFRSTGDSSPAPTVRCVKCHTIGSVHAGDASSSTYPATEYVCDNCGATWITVDLPEVDLPTHSVV